jgi:hypothetical protein
MNERIKELIAQAGFFPTELTQVGPSVEKFAELIIKDCIAAIQNESMNSYDDWERGLRIAEGAIEKHFGVEE